MTAYDLPIPDPVTVQNMLAARRPFLPEPVRSPWVDRAIAGTLPAPTLAPTQADIDAELSERFRFAFRVRG